MTERAFYSAVSGLKAHDQWLDVIGNNLSNVNTVAYKSSRMTFRDQFSQTLLGGAGGNASNNMGGTNPEQVGLGTRVGSIETLFLQGPTLMTGNATDLSIQGDGFLIAKRGSETYFTRAGNLTFDSNGFLVDQNGGLIQGFNATTQYRQRVIDSFSNVPGQPLAITDAGLDLDTSDISRLNAIRINSQLTIPPKATSVIRFKGTLDGFQQANQPGGVLDLFPGGASLSLPLAINILVFPPGIAMDPTRLVTQPTGGGGFTLKQVSNLSATVAYPIMNGGIDLNLAVINGGNYAWEQQPPLPPARQVDETIYDSLGNPREITVLFYQVNDLGTAVPPVNPPPGPSQTCYVWYAFDTSGGKPVATANLVGGTGIIEGDMPPVNQWWYDRGQPNTLFMGDFIWFNTDGSLASSGGSGGPVPTPPGVPNFMTTPRVYLPPFNQNPPLGPLPTQGGEIMAVDLDFGTFGILGNGRRDGLIGDVSGSYQVVNGVNTYVPNHTASAVFQDGYPDGILQGVQVDQTGTFVGTFSNGQKTGLAQLALANVDNPGGLNKAGDNGFTSSVNSGATRTGLAGQNGFGIIQGGSLEGSNVDLSVELSNMIVAQRGFEANARVISVSESGLQVSTDLGR